MPEELQEEETSITAIYGTGKKILEKLSSEPLLYAIKFPSQPAVSLRIEFPENYPDAPPSILGTQTVGESLAKGDGAYLVDLAREVLAEVYTPGAPCIFDLVEEVDLRIQQLGMGDGGTSEDHVDAGSSESSNARGVETIQGSSDHLDVDDDTTEPPPPWTLSEVITEKKSIFIARCAPVTSVNQATKYLHHLLTTDKKVSKATHNITAWRIQGENGVQYQDCDDDGETAAGGRILHLLELMKVWNLMVVVTRWYGGVQLGPDRFRIVNQTARDALVRAGFSSSEGNSRKGEGKKGKK